MQRVSEKFFLKIGFPKNLRFLGQTRRRQNQFRAAMVRFSIPDEFVVGYGMDYAGQYPTSLLEP